MNKIILGHEVVCLKDVSHYLGLYATAARIKKSGVAPISESQHAVYYRKSDLPLIAQSIAMDLLRIAKATGGAA